MLLSAGDTFVAPNSTPAPFDTLTPPSHTPTLIPTGTCSRPPGWIDHIVQPGEDLSSIAAQYEIETTELARGNCLTIAALETGQALFVPLLSPTVTASATPTVTPTASATPTRLPCGPPLGWPIYIVKQDDTLFSIARRFNSTVQELMEINCLINANIRVGQRLVVPRLPIVFTATIRPTPTLTPSPTASATPTILLSATPSQSPSAETPGPTVTISATPSETPTPAADTPTPTTSDTVTASVSPSATVSASPTAPPQTPTPSPTVDVLPSDTPLPTPTPTTPPTAP